VRHMTMRDMGMVSGFLVIARFASLIGRYAIGRIARRRQVPEFVVYAVTINPASRLAMLTGGRRIVIPRICSGPAEVATSDAEHAAPRRHREADEAVQSRECRGDDLGNGSQRSWR
jgi:hypothetical protein